MRRLFAAISSLLCCGSTLPPEDEPLPDNTCFERWLDSAVNWYAVYTVGPSQPRFDMKILHPMTERERAAWVKWESRHRR